MSFTARIVPMIIEGMGLAGHEDHSLQETAKLRSLSVRTKRAAVTLLRLSQVKAVVP